MAIIIEQKPAYDIFPVGQEVIFSLSDFAIVSTKTNVKFIALVFISNEPINILNQGDYVGTFKTTPNAAGVGMFDLSSVIESYVNADNIAKNSSSYKGAPALVQMTPLHLIDKYSRNTNIARYFQVVFLSEYLDTTQSPPVIAYGTTVFSNQMTIINGYLKSTDILNSFSGDFGYYIEKFFLSPVVNIGDLPAKWLTNAPDVRYALPTDYGVASLFSFPNNGATLGKIRLTYNKTDGTVVTEEVDNDFANGGTIPYNSNSDYDILHFGCYPANIYGWSVVFKNFLDAGEIESYTVQGYTTGDLAVTYPFTINILCPNQKGYEPIRLTWLNQWGTWDYYTFNMKSSKSISTKGSTYEQLGGTWNEMHYRPYSFKGGKKSFRVNATEKVIMNTDFVNESESEWFEELINSPEIYILEGYQTDPAGSSLNNYVTPVRLQTSSYTRKTVANDKLMQYTFEVEKSKMLRTQAV
mgnify:FL=1